MTKRTKRRRVRRFAGTPTQHRRDASVFSRNARKALQDFNRLMKSGNCGAAYQKLIVAHLRGAEAKVSRDYTTGGNRRGASGMIRALISASGRFQRGCLKSSAW